MKELENYKYSINTEVKYKREWQKITEVWFEERKIGLKETGHLVNYREIEDIRG